MTIQLIVDNVVVPIKVIKFSDGGSNIKLEVPQQLIDHPPSAYYSISVDPTTPVDNYLWDIYLTLDALHRTFKDDGKFKRILHLPYLPHGRADRVFEAGNPFPLNLFIKHILLQFDEIFLTDPHSSWCEDHIPEGMLNIKTQHQCFIEVAGRGIQSGDVLIAPDKGALNKIYKLQQALDYRMIATTVVEAGKKRDVGTGRIIETMLPDGADLNGKSVWIVDDISDGNGTFIPLAIKLKEAGVKEVNMYVTHLIAAKGLGNLFGIVDKLYTYQVVGNYINMEDVRKFNAGIEPRKF
jgi:ribose-phosphate pyrophosphokinase